MNDIHLHQSFITATSDLVDIIMLESETDFEHGPVSYETAKTLVIQQMLPLVINTLNDESSSESEKLVSVTAALSHVALENFFLHAEIQKIKHPS
jgi:hypothetical protein